MSRYHTRSATNRLAEVFSERNGALAASIAVEVLGVAAILYASWPGVMIDDARWQYQQAVDNAYEDWHPPLMAWIWHHLIILAPGPGPMLLLQLSLYWVGIALIAAWLCSQESPRYGIAAACAGWIPAPFALLGSVTKDCLMAATLVCAVGCLLWSKTLRKRAARWTFRAVTLLALSVAAALRVNAFLACAPLALALMPTSFVRTVPRAALAGIGAIVIFGLIPAVVAAALHAEKTNAELSLIIFDLGGITENSGVNQFPDMKVANPVAVNHGCYDPIEWDSYSTWARRPCPLGFERFQSLVDEGSVDARMTWLNAVMSHSLAYARHRLTHFNLSIWFLVRGGPDFTAWTQSVPNPWNFHVTSNPILSVIGSAVDGAAKTPLGWPVFWIALALATLVLARTGRLGDHVSAVAGSSFLYGAGYLIFGVATGMRYYAWTIIGAAISAILAVSQLSRRPLALKRGDIAIPSVIVLAPTCMAALARLVP